MVLYNLGKNIFSLCLILSSYKNGENDNDECETATEIRLQPSTKIFEKEGVVNYALIIFEPANRQLLVAATDNIFRIQSQSLEIIEETNWSPNSEEIKRCSDSRLPKEECRNHIKVLHIVKEKIFTCGTYANNPKCSWRKLHNLGSAESTISGYQRTSFRANHSVTSLIVGEHYYVGTTLDALGINSGIVRLHQTDVFDKMETELEKSWLWEPSFISSFQWKEFVYFFFNEKGKDDSAYQQDIYPRIARVCQADKGSTAYRIKSMWLTFQKARFDCSLSGDQPFHFNRLQNVLLIPGKNLLYGLFATPEAALGGSAVCVFDMLDLPKAFDGPFSDFNEKICKSLRHQEANMTNYQCKEPGLSEERENKDPRSLYYQMMANSVKSKPSYPIMVSKFDRFNYIEVMVIPTRASGDVTVVFLASKDGLVCKLRILANSNSQKNSFCLLDIYYLFSKDSESSVLTMKYVDEMKALYFGTYDKLIQIDAALCDRFTSKESCISSDPHCGWDTKKNTCASAPNNNPKDPNWSQSVMKCPTLPVAQVVDPIVKEIPIPGVVINGSEGPVIIKERVDGGWSKWSGWQQCERQASKSKRKRVKRRVRRCLFRERRCDNPRPAGEGRRCMGLRIQIAGSGGSSKNLKRIPIKNVVTFVIFLYLKIYITSL